MSLTEEEQSTLDALTAKKDQPDGPSEDFEVEWWTEDATTGNRTGGRIPWSHGKKLYGNLFPEIFGDKPPQDPKKKNKGGDPGSSSKTSERYFGGKS